MRLLLLKVNKILRVYLNFCLTRGRNKLGATDTNTRSIDLGTGLVPHEVGPGLGMRRDRSERYNWRLLNGLWLCCDLFATMGRQISRPRNGRSDCTLMGQEHREPSVVYKSIIARSGWISTQLTCGIVRSRRPKSGNTWADSGT